LCFFIIDKLRMKAPVFGSSRAVNIQKMEEAHPFSRIAGDCERHAMDEEHVGCRAELRTTCVATNVPNPPLFWYPKTSAFATIESHVK